MHPRVRISRKLELGEETGLVSKHPNMECRHPKWRPNHRPTCMPHAMYFLMVRVHQEKYVSVDKELTNKWQSVSRLRSRRGVYGCPLPSSSHCFCECENVCKKFSTGREELVRLAFSPLCGSAEWAASGHLDGLVLAKSTRSAWQSQ